MNIPARYCTGYLGVIDVPKDSALIDFNAWFEVSLDGRWFSSDVRQNRPRIGRIVIARGRAAADVAISARFGSARLARYTVIDEGVEERQSSQAAQLDRVAAQLSKRLHNDSACRFRVGGSNPSVRCR
jgi:transglutaminase-like putative cysteine protease